MKHVTIAAAFCALFAFAQAAPFDWGRAGDLNSGERKPPGSTIPDNSNDMSMGHMNGDQPDTKERFVKWLQEHKGDLAKAGAFSRASGGGTPANVKDDAGKTSAGGSK